MTSVTSRGKVKRKVATGGAEPRAQKERSYQVISGITVAKNKSVRAISGMAVDEGQWPAVARSEKSGTARS